MSLFSLWRKKKKSFCFTDGVMSPGQVLSVQAQEPEAANSVHCPPVAVDQGVLLVVHNQLLCFADIKLMVVVLAP